MRNRVIIFVVLSLLLIGIGVYFIQHMDEKIEISQENKPAVKKNITTSTVLDSEKISVINVEGNAEKKSRSGNWTQMNKGDILAVDDSVRTQKESKVILGLGETSTIELNDASEIEVRELSGAVQRLGLIKGRASVDYSDNGDRILNIENSDGTIVAKVDEGKFSILNNGQIVAVATETGKVDLSSAGENVTITEGMESIAMKGEAPVTPYKISAEAYLKLSSGACRKQSDNQALVHGAVSKGTLVSVNKQNVKVNPDGSFVAYVRITAKTSKVSLKTVDVWGKTNDRRLTCLEPKSRAPIKKIDIDWGTKGGQ